MQARMTEPRSTSRYQGLARNGCLMRAPTAGLPDQVLMAKRCFLTLAGDAHGQYFSRTPQISRRDFRPLLSSRYRYISDARRRSSRRGRHIFRFSAVERDAHARLDDRARGEAIYFRFSPRRQLGHILFTAVSPTAARMLMPPLRLP